MQRLTGYLAALVIAFSAAACDRTDSGVTTKVKAKFAQDELVQASDIDVTTREGVVTLRGGVDSLAARQQAARLASETEGVTDVVNELRVDVSATGGDLDDLEIDVDVDRDVKETLREAGEAVRDAAEETTDAARKTGKAARDAVTDDDPDSDRDGK